MPCFPRRWRRDILCISEIGLPKIHAVDLHNSVNCLDMMCTHNLPSSRKSSETYYYKGKKRLLLQTAGRALEKKCCKDLTRLF